MFDGLFIASLVGTCINEAKRMFKPTITAEQRANKKLLDQDIIKGVPYKQIQKNIREGKYRLTEPQTKVEYPAPHRDPVSGKIVIENCTLYNQDVMKYSGYQIMEWAKQGRYNLTSEELKKE